MSAIARDATFEVRFWSKVHVDPDGCWTWIGAQQGQGYGAVWAGLKWGLAHRAAYEYFVGPIPDGLQIDHLCRNRLCVNPDHLEPVTQRENLLRGIGVTAKNAGATHCPQGHPYDEANTIRRAGRRLCRACARTRKERWRQQRREAGLHVS